MARICQALKRGWVDAQHCIPGSPMLVSDPIREAWWRAHLKELPWTIEPEAGQVTHEALRSVCRHRQWIAHALHVRMTHVHAAVAGDVRPERMLCDFKAYATRALRSAFPEVRRRRYWADHGSTRYLWNEVSFRAAVDYALNQQGAKMACSSQSELTCSKPY